MLPTENKPYGGRYELIQKIARGGMAEVYMAKDQLLDRPVALKVLFPELSVNVSFVERFRREAQAAANLSHPNIVSVFDWGEADNTYYIVMELVDGITLASLIQESERIEPYKAASIAAEVAASLSFAHKHGVIHRDVKPSNVLLTEDGQVKVADFGIARAATADGDLTQTGAVMGTATYIPPEQAQGLAVDGRSDVYSLGVVLYEMLVGKVPFTGDSPLAIAYKHVREEPVHPRTFVPEIPEALEAIVMKAMAKDPSARYQSALEMRDDLLRFLNHKEVAALAGTDPGATQALPLVAGFGGASQPTEVIRTAPITAVDRERRGPNWLVIGIILLLIIIGALLLGAKYFFGSGSPGAAAATTVQVPSVIGESQANAVATLTNVGLKSSITKQDSNESTGTVLSENPNAGVTVTKGSTVALVVSSGVEQVAVPNVVGQPLATAESTLLGAGFQVTTNYSTNPAAAGTVFSESPPANTQAPKGSTVTLGVSNGPSQVAVPNVVGQPLAQAANTLGSHNLTMGSVTYQPSPSVPSGDVMSTNPVAGTNVAPNTPVDMVVSQGPSPSTTTTAPSASTTTTFPNTTTTAAG
ncbi:MAG: Stk1 family PASTA domain-containing Ser/Thr kinase [Actinomycetota bacterium]|nr:MAG: Stk1 family PASTA domain-containing Ser/Thr kinase [Actinomycetota bacterium]